MIACNAGIGLAAAAFMTQSHPLTGLIFGGVYHVVTNLTERALFCCGLGEAAKTVRIALGILAGIAASGMVLSLLGTAISVEAACTLTLAMVVARFMIQLLSIGCVCCYCRIGAAIL